jgi:integrase
VKAAPPVPNAEELHYERVWVRHRVNALFESDPGGYQSNVLRRVAKAMRHDLDVLATAASTSDFLDMHDLERVLIVMYSRLDAALDLDEYFERGRWGSANEQAARAESCAAEKDGVLCPIASITRDDIKALVEKLDSAVAEKTIGAKTALNIWGVVRKLFDDSANAKFERCVCGTATRLPACADPDRGAEKAKTFLYPPELLAFVACEEIPLRWRQLVAITVYTYARPGELEALDWEDVDLEHGTIHIHRAIDRQRDIVKSTKTSVPRRIPIEANLLPLLEAMNDESSVGRVLDMPQVDDLAQFLRKYLKRAGVERGELFADDDTRKKHPVLRPARDRHRMARRAERPADGDQATRRPQAIQHDRNLPARSRHGALRIRNRLPAASACAASQSSEDSSEEVLVALLSARNAVEPKGIESCPARWRILLAARGLARQRAGGTGDFGIEDILAGPLESMGDKWSQTRFGQRLGTTNGRAGPTFNDGTTTAHARQRPNRWPPGSITRPAF